MSVELKNTLVVACSHAQVDKNALKKSIFVLSGVAGVTLIAAVVTTILATTILAVAIGPILFGVLGATSLVIAILVGVHESSNEKNGKEKAPAQVTAPAPAQVTAPAATQETETQETATPVIETETAEAEKNRLRREKISKNLERSRANRTKNSQNSEKNIQAPNSHKKPKVTTLGTVEGN